MLKSAQLQGGFAPLTPRPGALLLGPTGGSAPRPPLYIKHGTSQYYWGASNSLAPALIINPPALQLCRVSHGIFQKSNPSGNPLTMLRS